jgi:hypothetical protein
MATITLELTPELENQLRDEAFKQGLDPDRYILNLLQQRLRPPQLESADRSKVEAELLHRINLGLPPELWDRYHTLIAKRRAEQLTPDEQKTLIELSDRIEHANAHRIEAAIELATLRNASLEAVMEELGINAPPYV